MHNRGIYGIMLYYVDTIFSGACRGSANGKGNRRQRQTVTADRSAQKKSKKKRLWEDEDELDLGYFNWHKFTRSWK